MSSTLRSRLLSAKSSSLSSSNVHVRFVPVAAPLLRRHDEDDDDDDNSNNNGSSNDSNGHDDNDEFRSRNSPPPAKRARRTGAETYPSTTTSSTNANERQLIAHYAQGRTSDHDASANGGSGSNALHRRKQRSTLTMDHVTTGRYGLLRLVHEWPRSMMTATTTTTSKTTLQRTQQDLLAAANHPRSRVTAAAHYSRALIQQYRNWARDVTLFAADKVDASMSHQVQDHEDNNNTATTAPTTTTRTASIPMTPDDVLDWIHVKCSSSTTHRTAGRSVFARWMQTTVRDGVVRKAHLEQVLGEELAARVVEQWQGLQSQESHHQETSLSNQDQYHEDSEHNHARVQGMHDPTGSNSPRPGAATATNHPRIHGNDNGDDDEGEHEFAEPPHQEDSDDVSNTNGSAGSNDRDEHELVAPHENDDSLEQDIQVAYDNDVVPNDPAPTALPALTSSLAIADTISTTLIDNHHGDNDTDHRKATATRNLQTKTAFLQNQTLLSHDDLDDAEEMEWSDSTKHHKDATSAVVVVPPLLEPFVHHDGSASHQCKS